MLLITLAIAAALVVAGGATVVARSRVRTRPQPLDLTITDGAFSRLAADRLGASPSTASLELANGTVVTAEELLASAGEGDRAHPTGKRAGHANPAGSLGSPEAQNAAALTALTAGAGGVEYLRLVANLDQNVLQALTAISGRQVDSLGDLRSAVDAKDYDLFSIKLRGHIAEQDAFDHLQDAGMDVQWPVGGATPYGDPSNPGYDLVVNGHEVNVKVVGDANSLSEHFDRYPDTPVVLNVDAKNIPDDAIHFDSSTGLDPSDLVGDHVVLVDDALRLTGIEALQDHAADAVDFDAADVGDAAPGIGVLIRVVRAGYREGKLLHDGKTDGRRAAKNVAIDVGVAGGGALAVGKAGFMGGAAIDAMFLGATGGAFAALGGLGGAILGGMAGGKVANDVKAGPLREATGKLERELKSFNSLVEAQSAQAERRLNKATSRREVQLQGELDQRHAEYQDTLEGFAAQVAELALGTHTQRVGWFDQTHAELRELLVRQRTEVENGSRFNRSRRLAAVEANEEHLVTWARAATEALEVSEHTECGAERFYDVLAAAPRGHRLLEAWLDDVISSGARSLQLATAAHAEFSRDVKALRADAVSDLNQARADEVAAAQSRIQDGAKVVEKAKRKVIRERNALGLS